MRSTQSRERHRGAPAPLVRQSPWLAVRLRADLHRHGRPRLRALVGHRHRARLAAELSHHPRAHRLSCGRVVPIRQSIRQAPQSVATRITDGREMSRRSGFPSDWSRDPRVARLLRLPGADNADPRHPRLASNGRVLGGGHLVASYTPAVLVYLRARHRAPPGRRPRGRPLSRSTRPPHSV